MKKIHLLIFLLLSVLFVNAQISVIKPKVISGSSQYNSLKSQGILNQYDILVDSGNSNAAINYNAQKATTTTSTLTPCDNPPYIGANPYLPSSLSIDDTPKTIALPFTFCFYGVNYTSLNVYDNGNVQFATNSAAFTSTGFPSSVVNMIAPFWSDGKLNNLVGGLRYGKILVDLSTPTRVIISWDSLPYYQGTVTDVSKLNSFQLVLTDGVDPILPAGKNVGFYYKSMQWTTGNASSGLNGFPNPSSPPPSPATVGINAGDGINYFLIGRFGVSGTVYDGPYGNDDGISWLNGKRFFFDACTSPGANTAPITTSGYCDTLNICAMGDTLVYSTTFLAPEQTQTVTVSATAPTLGGSFIPLNSTTPTPGTTIFNWMVVASSTVTGTHQVFITGTDNGTPPLSSTVSYFIKIKNISLPQPTISISPSNGTICANPGATLSLISPSIYDSYSWSTGVTGTPINVNSTGAYYLTVQKNGCYKSIKDSVTVLPNPTPVVFGPLNYCSPATSTTLSLNPPAAGMPAYATYTWATPAINTPTAALTSGVKTVTVTDVNGCKGSTTFTITSGTPTVAITANPISICGAGTTTLTASISGADSYSWTNGATTQTTSVSSAGVVGVTVTASGCVAINTLNIVVNPTPTITLPPTVGMCSGASAIVTPNSITPSGPYTYTWSSGSHASSLTVNTATIITIQVTNTLTGCVSSISNSCTIVVATNPTVSLSNSAIVFCNGNVASLTPTVTGGTPAYSYSWSPASLGTASVATTGAVGTYTLLVSDQNLCKGTATVSAIKSIPSVTLASPDLTLCPGDCAILTASGASSYTPVTYAWSNSLSTSSTRTVCSIGTTTVTITDSKGCTATNTITTIGDIIPVANFTASPSPSVTPGQVITFTNTSTISSGTITTNTWAFGDGNGTAVSNPTYAYTDAGSFVVTLIVTGSNGCKDTISEIFVVDAILNIPNVITPNGDGINDYLKFKNLEVYSRNTLSIYNRWGKKIYEQDNYKNDWNGGSHTDGTYFLILSVPDAKPQVYQGYFQLFK